MVIELSKLVMLVRATIFAPGKLTREVAIRRLRRQNPGLIIAGWRILGSKETEDKVKDKMEMAIGVLMEEPEVAKLRAMDFRPFCGAAQAYVLLRKQEAKAEGKPQKDAKMSEDRRMADQALSGTPDG